MVEDKILKTMQRQLDDVLRSYKEKMVKKHGIVFFPLLLSVNYRQNDKHDYTSSNGGLIKDNKKREGILTVEARIFDLNHPELGHSTGYSTENVSIEYNARNLGRVMRNCFNTSILHACNLYLEAMSGELDSRDIKLNKLSKEDPVNFEENEKKLQIDHKSLVDILNKSTNRIFSGDEIVDNAIADFSYLKSDRRYISIENLVDNPKDLENMKTQKSAVKTSEVFTYTNLAVQFDDIEGRTLKHYVSFANLTMKNPDDEKIISGATERLNKIVQETKNAEIQDSGYYKIIFGGHATGTLFHEAIAAHMLSGQYIKDNESTVFKDKIGKKVLPLFISIEDDPTLDGEWGSYKIDEEGVFSKKAVLVENGVLKEYLHDRSTAAHFSEEDKRLKSNGHSRCDVSIEDVDEDESEPEPRASNIIVKNAIILPKEELFKRAVSDCKAEGDDYFLFVPNAYMGQVEVEDGGLELDRDSMVMYRVYFEKVDDNVAAKFKMEDLRFVPVTSAKILGTPYSVLNKIKAMGGEMETSIGFCGSDSGWVRIAEQAPMAYGEVEVEKLGGETNPMRLIDREDSNGEEDENLETLIDEQKEEHRKNEEEKKLDKKEEKEEKPKEEKK